MFSGNSAQRTSRVHNLTRSLNLPLSYNNCVGHSFQLLNFTGQTIVKRFSSPMAEYTMIDTTEINRYPPRGDQTFTVLSRPEKYNRTFKTPVTTHDHTISLDHFQGTRSHTLLSQKYPYSILAKGPTFLGQSSTGTDLPSGDCTSTALSS